jgi:hypothetical protein
MLVILAKIGRREDQGSRPAQPKKKFASAYVSGKKKIWVWWHMPVILAVARNLEWGIIVQVGPWQKASA